MSLQENDILYIVAVSSISLLVLSVFLTVIIILFAKRMRAKQIEMFKAVLQTQENERQRIGKDLHDEMGPLLSAVKLHMQLFKTDEPVSQENVSYIEGLLDEAVQGIRSSSHELMPATLNTYGLSEATRELCNKVATKHPVLKFSGKVNFPIEKTAVLNIYRIVQELLNNALKHSKASLIHVEFLEAESALHLIVKDNGVGFTGEGIKNRKGIGLTNIESRVNLLGGKLLIKSEPNQETVFNISFAKDKITSNVN